MHWRPEKPLAVDAGIAEVESSWQRALEDPSSQLGPERELTWLRQKVSHVLGCGPHERGLWGPLLGKLVLLSGDPDSEAASWPRRGTPVGIVNEIPEGGVFPKIDEDTLWLEGDRLDSLAELDGALNNYKSYEEELEAADALFQKEVDKGFVHWSKSRAELENKFGALVPSATGYISKIKLDGRSKADRCMISDAVK